MSIKTIAETLSFKKNTISNYYDNKHRDYYDQYNSSKTYFGISPTNVEIELIRYNIFYSRSAITRKMLHYF